MKKQLVWKRTRLGEGNHAVFISSSPHLLISSLWSQVAEAPKVNQNRIVSLRELDHDKAFNLMPQRVSATPLLLLYSVRCIGSRGHGATPSAFLLFSSLLFSSLLFSSLLFFPFSFSSFSSFSSFFSHLLNECQCHLISCMCGRVNRLIYLCWWVIYRRKVKWVRGRYRDTQGDVGRCREIGQSHLLPFSPFSPGCTIFRTISPHF